MSRKRGCTKSKTEFEPNIKTLPGFECRVCLQTMERSEGIQMLGPWVERWKHDRCTIAQDFEKVTNIQISPTDNISKFICNSCLKKLKNCLQFIQTARHSDEKLHKRHMAQNDVSPTKPLWPKPIQIDKVVGSDHLEVEVKQEVLTDDDNVMETEELDNEELSMDIKVEPEEYQYKESPIHGIFSHDNVIQVNGDQHIDNNLDAVVKEEPMSEQEDVEMAPDMPLDCMLCTKTFNSLTGLKAHVIAQHSYVTIDRKNENKKQLFSCTTCRRNFFTNTDLIVHETCHYEHACYMCHTKFDTFAQLTKHRKKCPKNTKCVTRVKTLEDVKRPSPEPHLPAEDKETKLTQTVPESDQIVFKNTELKSPLEISDVTESNENEQQTSIEIEQTKVNNKEVPNDQKLESESLDAQTAQSELNIPNIELHSPDTETNAAQINTSDHILESNNSKDNSKLELNNSLQSDVDNTNSESNDSEMASKTSNRGLITAEDRNTLNLELLIPNIELKSAETDKPIEISGDFEEVDTVKTTVVIGCQKNTRKLHVESNSSYSESMEPNSEFSPEKEYSKPDSSHPETNSPKTEITSLLPKSDDPETNSPATEITSLHPKSDSPNQNVDSPRIESDPPEPVSPDLESTELNNSPTALNTQLIESNTSIELNCDLPESAKENKPEEKSGDNGSTTKEVDSDMKIHLEIHSLDKKVTADEKNEIKVLDTAELNEDDILQ